MKVTLELPDGTMAITVTTVYDDPHVIEPICVDTKAFAVEDGHTYGMSHQKKKDRVSE